MIEIYILKLACFAEQQAMADLPAQITLKATEFKLVKKRIEYLASQWLRHRVLSQYLDGKSDKLRFATTHSGRPYLLDSDIDFNISHTKDYVVMAVAKGQKVGIDVQIKKEKIDALAIAKQYFAESEYKTLLGVTDLTQRSNQFYWLWAYKEASLKLTGEGIVHGLDRYAFDVDSNGKLKSVILAQRTFTYFSYALDQNTLMCLAFENKNSPINLCYL